MPKNFLSYIFLISSLNFNKLIFRREVKYFRYNVQRSSEMMKKVITSPSTTRHQ